MKLRPPPGEIGAPPLIGCTSMTLVARADENLLGYIKGAETLPAGAMDVYETLTCRGDKGHDTDHAFDADTQIEYGITDRLTGSVWLKAQSIRTEDLLIDAYIPKDERCGFRPAGVEMLVKYNFLKPALDPIGLAATFGFDYSWPDPQSGQNKDTSSFETGLQAQKFFLDDPLYGSATLASRRPWPGGTRCPTCRKASSGRPTKKWKSNSWPVPASATALHRTGSLAPTCSTRSSAKPRLPLSVGRYRPVPACTTAPGNRGRP